MFTPFQYEFFRNGIIAAALVGGLTGLMGTFIILRRMSYIGHGLSHAVFGGAVVSFVLNLNFYLGAGLWGFLSALLINRIGRRKKIGADAAIGIVTTVSFAIGVAIVSRRRHFTRNFEAALFGNVLGVTTADLWVILAVMLLVFGTIFFIYKQLLFMSYDEEVARAFHVRVELLDTIFALLLAATIIVSIQIMGVTLVAALVVIPPSIARMLTNSFDKMLIFSTLIGIISGIAGLYLSYYFDVASGAMIVIFAGCVFAVVSLLSPARLGDLAGENH